MPQSLTKLYAHLVFSTKGRQPFLDEIIRPRVHAYLATIVRNLDSPWVVVGGVADHVHILFDMGKLHAPVEFVELTKRESSKFIKTLSAKHQDFYWQRGYGMFSVPRIATMLRRTFVIRKSIIGGSRIKRSFRAFLSRYDVEYDEQHVWD